MARIKKVHKRKKIYKLKRIYHGLTNYSKRIKLLTSGLPFLSIIKGNKNWDIKMIQSEKGLDHTITSTKSTILKTIGYNGCFVTRRALYLLGYCFGIKNRHIVQEHLINTGVFINKKGGRLWSLVKGIYDSKFPIRVSVDVFPSMDIITLGDVQKEEEVQNYIKIIEQKLVNNNEK